MTLCLRVYKPEFWWVFWLWIFLVKVAFSMFAICNFGFVFLAFRLLFGSLVFRDLRLIVWLILDSRCGFGIVVARTLADLRFG